MKLKTFNEWSTLGYRICKGSKAVGHDKAGIALFSEGQVCKPYIDNGYYMDDEEDADFACAFDLYW